MEYEKLRKLIDYHVQLSFPAHPDSDELAEWILDLSEFDGYYLGIAISSLNQKKSCSLDFSDYNKMKNRLNCISVDPNKDKIVLSLCFNYLDSIRNVIDEVNEICKN